MKAYELLATPETWIKGATAMDKEGHHVRPSDPAACKFCLYGALLRCYRVPQKILDVNIFAWNDDPARTHEEVIQLLKELDI